MIEKIFQWFVVGPNSIRNTIIAGISLFIVEGILLSISAWFDKSYFLHEDGVGLLEHYGIWAIVLGDLAVTIMLPQIVKLALEASHSFPSDNSESTNRYLEYINRKIKNTLTARTREKNFLKLFMIMGVVFWLSNAFQTIDPVRYYGNDVYDSINHIFGYISMRLVLFTSWVVLYPLVGFICLNAGWILYKMIGTLHARNRLAFSVYNPDQCGGYSHFGRLNNMSFLLILVVCMELFIVLITHKKASPALSVGMMVASAAFIFYTYAVSYNIYKFMKHSKSKLVDNSYDQLENSHSSQKMLQHIWLLENVTYSPYGKNQKIVLSLVRVVPMLISISNLLKSI